MAKLSERNSIEGKNCFKDELSTFLSKYSPVFPGGSQMAAGWEQRLSMGTMQTLKIMCWRESVNVWRGGIKHDIPSVLTARMLVIKALSTYENPWKRSFS